MWIIEDFDYEFWRIIDDYSFSYNTQNIWNSNLNIKIFMTDVIKIAREIVLKNWHSEENFEKILNQFKKQTRPIFFKKWSVKTLQWLKKECCNKLDRIKDFDWIVEKNRDNVRTEIVFLLQPERIKKLISILNNIKDLKSWSPNCIDVWNGLIKNEDIEFTSLIKWFRYNIRKYSSENENWEVDWERIIKELINEWEIELANKFIIKN